jgi:ATP-binding cassette, subfamily B, bacterial
MYASFRRYMRTDEDAKLKNNLTWPLVKRVMGYGRPYWRHIIGLLLVILATTGLGLLTPLIFRDIIDNVLPNQDTTRLNVLALGLVLIPIVSGLIRVVQRKLNSTIGEGVIYDLRVGLFSHLQRLSLRFFTNTKTGEIISRLNNDVVGAQNAISSTVVDIVTNTITVVATLAVMLTLEWRLTLVGVAVLPLFIFIAGRLGNRLRDIAREQQITQAKMNALMNETLNISGALLVKLFGRTSDEIGRFDERASEVRDVGVRRGVISSQFFVLLGLVGATGTALVYWIGGHLVIGGDFTVGTIVAFGAYLTQLYGPMQALTNAPVDFATSVVSFERVFEIIDLPIEIDEKPDAVELADVKGEIVFDDVSFRYDVDESLILSDVKRYGQNEVGAALSGAAPRNGKNSKNGVNGQDAKPTSQARTDALQNISIRIEPGQLAALVGPSGAGKTTMTYLVPRLYDPSSGRITLDGHDLRDIKLSTLSEHIGMVTQETFLFNDTIRTNLIYAKPDATDAEIQSACKAANIHDFVMGLENGYDTVVGERGYRLSGGEKQRIAIARVILKDPRILVLDEATSNLDSQSEALIQDALQKVQSGRTSIVIAHRLSTILAADRIFVMDRGEVVEQGTHDELLAQGGLYAGLYETQFSAERDVAMGD